MSNNKTNFVPRNVLVTGAAGFIGCNYVRMMLDKYSDINIISFDKLTYAGSLDNLHDVIHNPRHAFIKGDICDRPFVAKVLEEHEVDTIVHFAAESHVDNSIAGPEVFFQTNVMGTLSLIDEARKFWQENKGWNEAQCRFHHVSTDEVYGSLTHSDPAFTELNAYKPNSPYSASKASSDHFVRAYLHTYKMPVTISNCSNNYGPYQHKEKLIPVIINACINQQTIPVYGDGSNIRDWLYVGDHCDAIDVILKNASPGSVYNIGADNEVTNIDMVNHICQILDNLIPENAPHKRLIKFVEDRRGHDFRYAINNSKIFQELGWKSVGNFKKMLEETVNFYLDLARVAV